MSKKNVVWLASYPKSGNTWFRSFLTALIRGELDINDMATDGIYSGKGYLEEILDLEVDDLNEQEMLVFRKKAFRYKAAEAKGNVYTKIHDAFTYLPWGGECILPVEVTRVAIYLVRNPLDVVLSMSNHMGRSLDDTITKLMCNSHASLGGAFFASSSQSRQLIGSWSMHVESWIDQKEVPVCLLRYEDMLAEPLSTFSLAVEQLGLTYSRQEISQAIELSRFERLKAQEEEKGFKERSSKSEAFFNRGQAGSWKEKLTQAQLEKLMKVHEKMMRRLGYWQEAEDFVSSMVGKEKPRP